MERIFLNSTTLASLRFFETVARLNSFKRAALELHVTQGAVSQQVKHLEDALGCRLFHRLPRYIALTEHGEKFATVVSQALYDINLGAKAVIAGSASASLRLRAGHSFALRWLVPRLGTFYAQYSHIKLFITGAYGYFDPARPGFDLAIEMTKERLPAFQSEPLMEEYLVPVCSAEYLARHAPLRIPNDFARCTLLHDAHAWAGDDESAEWRHWLRAVRAPKVDSKLGQFFSLANMSIEAAMAHQGVAMGRLSLVQDLVENGQLVMPFPRRIKSPLSYCVVYPKELADHPCIRAVVGWLHAQARSSNPSRAKSRINEAATQ